VVSKRQPLRKRKLSHTPSFFPEREGEICGIFIGTDIPLEIFRGIIFEA
jgi:hypothetical protein